MTDLLPCPHCEKTQAEGAVYYTRQIECVYCDNCGMRGPHSRDQEYAEMYWNDLPRRERYHRKETRP